MLAPGTDPDQDLARRAGAGDVAAFEQLVARHQTRLTTLAVRLLGSHADAADAVQETLVRAWLALPRFRGEAKLSTWLVRICLNAVHDVRERRGLLAAAGPEELPEAADPRDAFAESELAGELQRALAALDPGFREAVVLYDVLGCSYREVGEITGVAEGTVKSRIYRGRAELAALLAREAGRPGRAPGPAEAGQRGGSPGGAGTPPAGPRRPGTSRAPEESK